ncbi:MAG: hypothetical protein FWD60_11005 [Candidatus Azobacteroides sp.]|nr:hypothetical protein [Candidatus Azobacteroides sp.]
MLNKNTYFQADPLVARVFIVASCPYSLIPKDFINKYCPENKGIREESVAVVPATKGALAVRNRAIFPNRNGRTYIF